MSARNDILNRLRVHAGGDVARETHRTIPARAREAGNDLAPLFRAMAEKSSADVAELAHFADLPQAVAAYLARIGHRGKLVLAPHQLISTLPWRDAQTGTRAESTDAAVTLADAGIAETGSVLVSGAADTHYLLNFMAETTIVALPASRLLATMEDAFLRLRRHDHWPRALSFITGPSRTGDIEQKIELGAHGPRRLHIVIVGN